MPRPPMLIAARNETHSIREWAKIMQIPRSTIMRRMASGWTLERCVLTKPRVQIYSRGPKRQVQKKAAPVFPPVRFLPCVGSVQSITFRAQSC